MRPHARHAAALIFALLVGCTHPGTAPAESASPSTLPGQSATARPSANDRPRLTPSAPAPPSGTAEKFPAYFVQEWAFNDCGLSVKTNFEVTTGGQVQWMEISAIDPGGAAFQAHLAIGDRILAIGSTLVTELDRSALMAALFQRKKGELVRLLILGRGQGLPRFVTLRAGSP